MLKEFLQDFQHISELEDKKVYAAWLTSEGSREGVRGDG